MENHFKKRKEEDGGKKEKKTTLFEVSEEWPTENVEGVFSDGADSSSDKSEEYEESINLSCILNLCW